MKKLPFLLIVIIVTIIICQPIVVSIFTDNHGIINLFSSIVYLLIAYPIFLIYKTYKINIEHGENTILQRNKELSEELDKIKTSIKNKYIFYQHNIDEPFAWVSDSVSDILGINVEKFKANYKIDNLRLLYDGVFERVKQANENGIRVPVYEMELINSVKQKIRFEVRELPLYDVKNNLIGVWGVLERIIDVKTNKLNISSDFEFKYNLLFENISESVLIIKGDRFVDCNTNALELFDSSKEQLLMYSPFLRKYSPQRQPSGKNSKEEALNKIKLAYEGHPQKFIWQHLKNYGNAFMVEISLSRFEWNKEFYLMAILKDLTYKNKCIEERRQKNKLFNLLAENISKGITVIVDNKIEMTNSELESITSYTKEELNNVESLFIFAAELEKIRLYELHDEVISGSTELNELSYWFKKKDGDFIYIKNEYIVDKENIKNRYVLTSDITEEIIEDYKKNPTEELKKELDLYLSYI